MGFVFQRNVWSQKWFPFVETEEDHGGVSSLPMKTRMVVQGHSVQPAVHFSDLYEAFLLDKVRDTGQNQVFLFF